MPFMGYGAGAWCHTEPLGEVSSVESKQDISCLRTQDDKNLDSIKFAPLHPAPTQMVENLDSIKNAFGAFWVLSPTIYG